MEKQLTKKNLSESDPQNWYLHVLQGNDTSLLDEDDLTKTIELDDKLYNFLKKTLSNIETLYSTNYISEIESLRRDVQDIKYLLTEKRTDNFTILSSKIYDLNNDEYKLKSPIDIIIEIHDDETLAFIPELELYGEGENEFESLSDLKDMIIDLFEDLNEIKDSGLGKSPKVWKKILNELIEKCQ